MNQPTVYTILHIQKLLASWIHGACFSAPRLATFAGTTEPLVSQRLSKMLGGGGCRRDPLVNVSMESHHLELVGGIPTPNIKVSWDDDIPICIMEHKIHVRNHQHEWSSVNQGFLWESGPKIAVTSMTRGLNSWSSWNKPTMSSP